MKNFPAAVASSFKRSHKKKHHLGGDKEDNMDNENEEIEVEIPEGNNNFSAGRNRLLVDSSLPEVGVATEMRLLSVDDENEQFQVMMLIHTHYYDESIMDPSAQSDGFERLDNYKGYMPEIVMVNCVNTQYSEFVVVVRVNRKSGVVWTSFLNTCFIAESLELEKFPFDRQLFRVTFKSPNAQLRPWKLDVDMLDFPDAFEKGKAVDNTDSYLVACELKHWLMTDFDVAYFPDDDDPASLTKGEFEITIKAERDPKFFLLNYYLVMFLIVLTNVSVLAIDVAEAGDRAAVTLTLLLTLVAFKFVLLEGTPKVGYLTYMDMYVILAFAFLLIAVFENIFVSPVVLCYARQDLLCDPTDPDVEKLTESARRADIIFQFAFFFVWSTLNIAVATACYFPNLVRDPWEVVVSSQIGETEKTVKRTSKISRVQTVKKND